MSGRRRHPRFLLPVPVEALLRLREEVTVERWDARGIEVLSCAPWRRGERLTLEMAGNGHKPVEVVVRETRASISPGDALRYWVLLTIDDDPASRGEGGAL